MKKETEEKVLRMLEQLNREVDDLLKNVHPADKKSGTIKKSSKKRDKN